MLPDTTTTGLINTISENIFAIVASFTAICAALAILINRFTKRKSPPAGSAAAGDNNPPDTTKKK